MNTTLLSTQNNSKSRNESLFFYDFVESLDGIHKKILHNVQLKSYTTFKIGGPAKLFIEASSENELLSSIIYAKTNNMNWFLLGGGSNLVVSDDGFAGLVIKNNARDKLYYNENENTITISSGHKLSKLVEFAAENSLTGVEPFTGIPGTIGGAIYGNAGAYGRAISDILVKATLFDPSTEKVFEVNNPYFAFDYRYSILKKNHMIVLDATFKLNHGNLTDIKEQMQQILEQRNSKHPPLSVGSAGSYFKNLPPLNGDTKRRPAGELLDKAGAKQMSYGGARVYHKHANFIVNYGEATANDVRKLAQILKEKVYEMFGVTLEEEVIYVGF